MSEQSLSGKVALVTGGVSGIGLACARRLNDEGAAVIAADIGEFGDDTPWDTVTHDISSEDSWSAVMKHVKETHGHLDILVNCAGINGVGDGVPLDPENLSLAQFRKVMAVNGEGTFLGCRFGIAAMKESGGSIINIGSLSALLTMPNMFAYAASKSVIRYLGKAVAVQCADRGYDIRCNLVTPGATKTPLWNTFFDDAEDREAEEEKVLANIPLGRWTMPEDVAAAVLYLASDDARNVTGTEIVVDGGQYVKGRPTR